MIRRILTSTGGGIAITVGLFFVMQHLIATGKEVMAEQGPRIAVEFVRLKSETGIAVITPRPIKIDKPRNPPQTHLTDPTETEYTGIPVPAPPVPPTHGGPAITGFNFSDGPLINIFKVYPNYPSVASAKELEGFVTVQYDVTALGTVANVVIVESSNRVFNKAAIAAAYRFKYKPRVVDGVAYESKGLRNRFRFEMEQ